MPQMIAKTKQKSGLKINPKKLTDDCRIYE
jgi:hypothetical protein